jgi:hypothetical protein
MRSSVNDNPPISSAVARRSNARRLCRRDANGQTLAYIYSRESEVEAMQPKVLTKDEAPRIAVNIPKLPDLLGKAQSERGYAIPRLRSDAPDAGFTLKRCSNAGRDLICE